MQTNSRFAPARRLAGALALAIISLQFAACATSSGNRSDKTKSAQVEKGKRRSAPRNFSLFKPRELDQRLLKRGQRVMGGAAMGGY